MLARHAGASRFAYNQCLQLVGAGLHARTVDPSTTVPWSGYDLINAFNRWKRSEAAGRIFVAAPDGTITKQVTGLPSRSSTTLAGYDGCSAQSHRSIPTAAN